MNVPEHKSILEQFHANLQSLINRSVWLSIRHVRESDHVRENSHYINSNLRFYEIKSVNVLISFRHCLPLNRDPQARISSGRWPALESLCDTLSMKLHPLPKINCLRLSMRLQQNATTMLTSLSWLSTIFMVTYINHLSEFRSSCRWSSLIEPLTRISASFKRKKTCVCLTKPVCIYKI